jgi:hypothetical protein
MGNAVYQINKGVNRPMEFRGLKAQYIWWLGGAIAGLLLLFAVLYLCGVNAFVCLALVGSAGAAAFAQVYRMSRRYGQWGLMKRMAERRLPGIIKSRTTKIFRIWGIDRIIE